ncbi:MAG: TrkH family potassium uptake protein [Lachnospira sp.]|nr:TrkH family potassium uptake protein [Lachnospira sp.]
MNIPVVVYILGRVMQVEGAFMLLPAFVGLLYKETAGLSFLLVGGIEFLAGLLIILKKPENKSFFAKEGFVTVSLSWILLAIIGALPYVLNGDIPHYLDALFETVSGFTTTGASILGSVEALNQCSKFWRCFSNWIGGMGVLVFVLSILPLAGAQNIYLMKAESPGPTVGKLVPKVKSTAANLYKIYCGMTLIEVVLLLLGGLDGFSAITMSFATAGTGGFGILNSSCLEYSPYVQVVITIFMILFAVNFSVYYLLLTKRFRQAFGCEEMRWFFAIIIVAVIAITLNVWDMFDGVGEAVRHVAFTVGSLMTSTGFSTVDYNMWPEFSKTILLMLMFVGACAGSTGGGMKVSRMVIYLKSVKKMIEQYIHPRSIKIVKFEGKQVEHEVVRGINMFLITYIFLFAVSVLLISFDNFGFTTNFSAVAATINNTGPGLEMVGPSGNYAMFSPLSKMVLAFDMLAGRLEIFPLLLLFAPTTYKR